MDFYQHTPGSSSPSFFFFKNPAPPEISPLPLHDALPICAHPRLGAGHLPAAPVLPDLARGAGGGGAARRRGADADLLAGGRTAVQAGTRRGHHHQLHLPLERPALAAGRPQRQGSLHTAGRAATARQPGVGARVLHHGRRHPRGGTGTRRPGDLPATDPRRYRVRRLEGLTRKEKGASVTVEVASGVVAVDGTPGVLVSADYPYYRDDPRVWADRLRSLRDELGIGVVSAYVPWRHHQPDADRAPDFTGAGDPGRDVVGFVAHCHRLGLGVILKPGPFIHAETNYGGLPDWVRPLPGSGIEAVLDAAGAPAVWSGARLDPSGNAERWPLPAPLDPRFLALTRRWLHAVGTEVVRPYQHPQGPVRLVQIADEGLYTNGAQPLWAFDYSESALAFFRAGVRRWYGDLGLFSRMKGTAHTDWARVSPPREWCPAPDAVAQRRYVDWGRFHAEYLSEVYRLWSAALDAGVPVVVNLNPPAGEQSAIDAWLAPIPPSSWDGGHYGFTNWMGVVSADPGAHARYVIAAKHAPGPNLEENWGFSELYDRAYADAATSFHQTLLAMAAGATGFNVYTGVATQDWTASLDAVHGAPYPDSAPVDADGRPGPKAPVVRLLADFFTAHGREFLESVPAVRDAWAVYAPYASVAAWVPAGSPEPSFGRRLRAFHDRMRAAGQDYHLVDLAATDAAGLARYRTVTFHSGQFLDWRAQRALADYVTAGGLLRLSG